MIGELQVNLTAETREFSTGLQTVESGLISISDSAGVAQFNLETVSSGLHGITAVGNRLAAVSQHVGLLAKTTQLAGRGFLYAAESAALLANGATFAAAGVSILTKPLAGLVIIPKMIAFSFGVMWTAITVPFKGAMFVLKAFTKGMVTLLKPVIALLRTWFKIKFFFSSIQIQLMVLEKAFAKLSPKMRAAVAGLIALGAAGKAGSFAVRALTTALSAGLVVTNLYKAPIKTVGILVTHAAAKFMRLTFAIISATRAMARFAVVKLAQGLQAVAVAAASVAVKIGSSVVGAIVSATKAAGLFVAVGTGWGIKLAADAEQAEIAFTTMLKSADAAKVVLQELEEFAASTPFKLNDLRDGAKQLLNAQVPTSKLTDKLRMLGDIAAGTGKPIGDFVNIFAKVKSTGKLSLETLNQLARRGVPIYSELTNQLDVSREAMLKMISKGKIGFEELNAALTATATGTGVFAGGMKAQSVTIAGLWSTLTDNMGFAARELGIVMAEAFNFKGSLDSGIQFFQRIRAGISSAVPVFQAMAETVKAAFSSMWEIGSVTIAAIRDALGLGSNDIMTSLMTMFGVATYVFKEWPTIAELAFKQMGVQALAGFGHITHFFTGVIPALFSWFSKNWYEVFQTAGRFVSSVFTNMATNIFRIMGQIWDYIKSGGTKTFKVAWTPLLDGFKSTISEIPDIPPRVMGDLETSMRKDVEGLAGRVGEGMAKTIATNIAKLEDFRNRKVADLAAPNVTAEANGEGEDNQNDTRMGGASTGVAGVQTRGSAAAMATILTAQGKHRDKTLKVQIEQKKLLQQIATAGVNLAIQGGV